MPTPRLMAPAILLCAALAIISSAMGGDALWLHYLFKPLTTILILLQLWRLAAPISAAYRSALLGALVWSLAGDVFLMLPKTALAMGFELGLASFLIAHLFFLRAFTRDAKLFGNRAPLVLLLALSGANLMLLWPTIPAPLQAPVVAYMLCLVAMSAQAVSRALQLQSKGSRLAAIGGLCFLASDTMIAYNKFFTPLPASALLILGSYYGALYLIVDSARAD